MAASQTRLHLRTILLISLALALTSQIGCHAQPLATNPQPPATILIIRHAEKLNNGDTDLSSTGAQRAELLPQAFSGARPELPSPQVIFAAAESARSNRSVQTVTPLAEALHLSVDDRFNNGDYAALAKELLSGEYAGKIVLIAWHRGKIPELAFALGATPPYNSWPERQLTASGESTTSTAKRPCAICDTPLCRETQSNFRRLIHARFWLEWDNQYPYLLHFLRECGTSQKVGCSSRSLG